MSRVAGAQVSGGLVAAYSFDEGSGTVVRDSSGNNNSGSVVNASFVAGRYGSGLSFNGSSSMVKIPDSASLDLTKGMTLEAWVRPATVGGWQTVIMKESPGDLSYALYGNSDVEGGLGMYVRGAGVTQQVNDGVRLRAGRWAHVVATYNGTTMTVYRNGTAVSRAATVSADVSGGQLSIGGNSVWGEYFNGVIDNVRIYNRALTATEIAANRTAAVAGVPVATTAPATTTAPAPTTTAPATTTTTVAPTTTTTAPPPPPPVTTSNLNSLFPIGVFVPPAYLMPTWKARGANLALQVPDGNNLAEWDAAAAAAGMRTMRLPQNPVSLDATNKNLLGLFHRDEPDGIYQQIPYSQIQQQYAANKAALPNTPVLINFVGALNQYDIKTGESGASWYQKYMQGADWIGGDIYPANQCLAMSEVGTMVKKLRSWSGEKPTFAAIETGDYDTSNACPGPTADQVRGQIWSAVINGARGIYYFPVRVAPSFSFDVTPAAVASEMTIQNNRITALTSVLQPNAINPSTLGASVPAGFEVGWRDTPTGKYFFVLNLTPNTVANASITLNGVGAATTAAVIDENRTVGVSSGRIADTFGPYAVHIYKVG